MFVREGAAPPVWEKRWEEEEEEEEEVAVEFDILEVWFCRLVDGYVCVYVGGGEVVIVPF